MATFEPEPEPEVDDDDLNRETLLEGKERCQYLHYYHLVGTPYHNVAVPSELF